MNREPIEPDETAPALDAKAIKALHRDPNGYIGFVRKPDPAAPPRLDAKGRPCIFENLFSIQAKELVELLPSVTEWLTHDSYFTVNSSYRPAPYQNKLTGLPDVWRKEQYLSKLTGCYADIDCGRPESDEPGGNLSWGAALQEAANMADLGLIPYPSMLARSGRGAYLFWFLRDETNPDELQHAWPEKVLLYKECNRALNQRLLEYRLPADKVAIDAARVLRVPGSIHRKARRRVGYVIQLDEQGQGFTYTLPELAEFLGIAAVGGGGLPEETRRLAKPAQYRTVKNKGAAPQRSEGMKQLNALRAQDLLTIAAWRGGFIKRGSKYPDGTTSPGRRFILQLYANFLRGAKTNQAEALKALEAMAGSMKPAWPDEPGDETASDLIAEAYTVTRRTRSSNKLLCAWLGITPDIARELELNTILPDEVKQERHQAKPLQAEAIAARREWLRAYLHAHPTPGDGKRWTCRKVKTALSPFSPYPWENHETANQDLNAIGYLHRAKAGRPRRQAK